MSLTYEEKIQVINQYSELLERKEISNNRLNFRYNNKINLIAELNVSSGNGYIYVKYLKGFEDKTDKKGYVNIDKFVNGSEEFEELLKRAMNAIDIYY